MIYTSNIIGDIYKNDSCLRKDVKMKKITNVYNRFLPRSYTSKNFVSDDVVIERSEDITFNNCRFKNIIIKHSVKNICFVNCIIDSITLDNAVVRELKMTSCAVYDITSIKSTINNSIIHDIDTYKISGSYLIHGTSISRVKYSVVMMNDTKIVFNTITDVIPYELDYDNIRTFLNCEICNTYFTHCYFELSYFYNCTIKDNCTCELCLDDSKSADSIIEIPMVCPKEGSFIGYKQIQFANPYYIGGGMAKVRGIAVLEIPEDAKRINAGGKKCRASKVKVLRIESFDGEELDIHYAYGRYTSSEGQLTRYDKGEIVYPDSFDENRFNTCSNGIHFFMSREDAVHYNY